MVLSKAAREAAQEFLPALVFKVLGLLFLFWAWFFKKLFGSLNEFFAGGRQSFDIILIPEVGEQNIQSLLSVRRTFYRQAKAIFPGWRITGKPDQADPLAALPVIRVNKIPAENLIEEPDGSGIAGTDAEDDRGFSFGENLFDGQRFPISLDRLGKFQEDLALRKNQSFGRHCGNRQVELCCIAPNGFIVPAFVFVFFWPINSPGLELFHPGGQGLFFEQFFHHLT